MTQTKHRKGKCQNCNTYTELHGYMCEGCESSKNEQITAYGSHSIEVAW